MADIQAQIVEFDKRIRLSWESEEQTLSEKRDIILDKLRDRFGALRAQGESIPTFTYFNQGSYQMNTGIRPVNGDYDIDVGLRFNCDTAEYPNPVDLKFLVADALEDHTVLGTELRKSCVTVNYRVDGEQAYHVDLAVYAYDDIENDTRRMFLAKGMDGSGTEERWWEESDPQALIDWVKTRFQDAQREQFLRVIRALKRWKAEKFKMDGQNAPSGIGLTVAAGLWFQPQIQTNGLSNSIRSDDLKALRVFTDTLVSQFRRAGQKEAGSPEYRLEVKLPMAPMLDIFARMTVGQMTTFRERLIQLRDRLEEVTREPDTVRACELMRKDFGDDFPIPDKKDTARGGGRAIASSGVSA